MVQAKQPLSVGKQLVGAKSSTSDENGNKLAFPNCDCSFHLFPDKSNFAQPHSCKFAGQAQMSIRSRQCCCCCCCCCRNSHGLAPICMLYTGGQNPWPKDPNQVFFLLWSFARIRCVAFHCVSRAFPMHLQGANQIYAPLRFRHQDPLAI